MKTILCYGDSNNNIGKSELSYIIKRFAGFREFEADLSVLF